MDMNYWLRMRVVTQGTSSVSSAPPLPCLLTLLSAPGFTLLAMSWSMNIWPQILPEFDRQHPGWLAPLPPVGIADTAEAQKIGFEERMREAEETHHAEVANAPPEKVVVRSQSLKVDGSGMQGGYWRWLRWGSSGSASEGSGSTPAAPSTAATVSTPHPPTPVATEKPRQGTSWLGGLMGGSSSDSEKDKQSR